jgi:hypothetical protein
MRAAARRHRLPRAKILMLVALRNVCFWEYSGHALLQRICPLLTQSGHRPPEGISVPF